MSKFHNIRLTILVLVFAILGLSSNAKAGPVSFTLTNPVIDGNSGSFSLSGFFTNTGTTAFTVHRWDLSFSPDIGLRGVGQSSPCCALSNPVPGMSTTPARPLLDVNFLWQGEGVYTGTLSFSGFDANGLAITTDPVQFTVNVPVPEPATMLLLSSGLIALGASARRRRNALRQSPETHRQATP